MTEAENIKLAVTRVNNIMHPFLKDRHVFSLSHVAYQGLVNKINYESDIYHKIMLLHCVIKPYRTELQLVINARIETSKIQPEKIAKESGASLNLEWLKMEEDGVRKELFKLIGRMAGLGKLGTGQAKALEAQIETSTQNLEY